MEPPSPPLSPFDPRRQSLFDCRSQQDVESAVDYLLRRSPALASVDSRYLPVKELQLTQLAPLLRGDAGDTPSVEPEMLLTQLGELLCFTVDTLDAQSNISIPEVTHSLIYII